MKKYFKLTVGIKLALFYLFLFVTSLVFIQTAGFHYIREMVLSEPHYPLREVNADQLTSVRIDYYYNVLLMLFYYMAAIVGIAFIFIYLTTSRPLHRIQSGAKHFSIAHENPPINVRSNDEYGQLAETLNVIGSELSKFDEYQRKFISNISHDFRSPLTSIRGYVQAMADGIIPPENQEKYLNIILYETDRLTKLTTDLLDVNNFDKDNVFLTVTDFDIHAIIAYTIDVLEGSAKKKNITFETEPSTEWPLMVCGDSDKIRQVLHNLMDNAVKFSHENASIYIRTRIQGEKVFISVKDTGIGIPKEDLPLIWDRFYKTDVSRGRDKRGTGLGLSICREIINAHKQTINVVSTAGVGSEFVFTLPKA